MLFSPKKPKAEVGHLPITQGMETATGLAPPRGAGVGWEQLPRLFLPNYGCSMSRGYASLTQNVDYGGVAEAARFQPMRSVTVKRDTVQKGFIPSPQASLTLEAANRQRGPGEVPANVQEPLRESCVDAAHSGQDHRAAGR